MEYTEKIGFTFRVLSVLCGRTYRKYIMWNIAFEVLPSVFLHYFGDSFGTVKYSADMYFSLYTKDCEYKGFESVLSKNIS